MSEVKEAALPDQLTCVRFHHGRRGGAHGWSSTLTLLSTALRSM
jgi:hypothetical protein